MLLAVTVGPGLALLGALAVAAISFAIGAALVALAWLFYFGRGQPASNQSTAGGLTKRATLAAFVAKAEGLGVFKNLFEAIAENDREKLYQEAEYLSRVVKDAGSFANVLETFVLAQLKQRLQDPSKKRSLLDFIGATIGVDVNAAVESQAKAATSSPTVPAVSAVLVCLALLFGASSLQAGEIRGPQLYEATTSGPVIDPPTHPQKQPTANPLQYVRDAYGRVYLVQPASLRYDAPAPASWKRLGDLTFDDRVYYTPAAPQYSGPQTHPTLPCVGPYCPLQQPASVPYRRGRWRR